MSVEYKELMKYAYSERVYRHFKVFEKIPMELEECDDPNTPYSLDLPGEILSAICAWILNHKG